MKSFQQFREDSTSDTQAAISGSGSGKGGSGIHNVSYDRSFKKRPSTGLGNYAWDKTKAAAGAAAGAAGAIRDKLRRTENPKNDGPGQRPDRKPNPYRQAKQSEKGGALAKRPEERGSMVAKKSAASKQPPQHKQITARPASTAMAGSRQRAAIKPTPERKALPPSQRKRLAAQPNRPGLPPAGFRAKDLRARG